MGHSADMLLLAKPQLPGSRRMVSGTKTIASSTDTIKAIKEMAGLKLCTPWLCSLRTEPVISTIRLLYRLMVFS